MHVLLYPILPSYNWPSSPKTLNFIHTFFSQTLHPLNMTKPPKTISFHPFHHSTLHSICTNLYVTFSIHGSIALTILSCLEIILFLRSLFTSMDTYLFINSLWCSVTIREYPLRGWPWQNNLQTSLPKHSLLASSIPLPLSATLPCMYSFTLSFPSYNWPSSPRTPQFHSHILFSQTLHSSFSQDDQSISFHPFYCTTLHSICTDSH